MRLRQRAKWVWDRLSDISLASDIYAWIVSFSGIKVFLSLAAGVGAAVLAQVQHTPPVITLLSALLATAITFWLIDEAASVAMRFRGIAPAERADRGPRGWLSKSLGPLAMIGGVALLAFGWQAFQPGRIAPPPTTPTNVATPPSPRASSAAVPSAPIEPAKKAESREVEEVRPQPRIVYLPAPRPPATESKQDMGLAKPPSPPVAAAPAAPSVEAPKAIPKRPTIKKEVLDARIAALRRHREAGDEVFNVLHAADTDAKVLAALNAAMVWDRSGADLVADYFGSRFRTIYLQSVRVTENYYHIGPDRTTTTTFFKRREYLNVIRYRQAVLSEVASQARDLFDIE